MLEHHQQQQQPTQHIQQLQYPLPHHVPGSTQPHPLSHTSPHLTPSPTNRMMLRRYSPLCLHLQLNEHQKRKKEKRERRQERRAEKKRLAEHEMALRIQMERESDESAIAREIARIEQSQLSQRGQTPATRQVQQSLTATLASPTYTNALMMQLEKLSGAQRIEHTTETTHIQQQQQQHNNPAAALPPRPSNKYSPTSTSPGPTTPTLHPTAHSPSALPVSSCPLPNSSFHLSTSNVSTQHIPAPLNPSLMSNTLTPHSPPSFRPVTSTTEMPTTSPGSHQRQLLTHDPESTSPSLTSRFLLANLSKHEKHEYTYSPTIPQIHDDECVELMDCAIEDIPTHNEDADEDETPMSLSQAMTSPPLSDHSSPAVMSETTSPSSKSLFSSFQHLLIHEHDEHEYDARTSFHVPHASYVSFGKEMV